MQCLQKLDIVNLSALEEVLDDLKESLLADRAFLKLEFPYFIQKEAPVSGLSSVMDLNCVYTMEKGTRFTRLWRLKPVSLSGLRNWRKWLMRVPVLQCTDC